MYIDSILLRVILFIRFILVVNKLNFFFYVRRSYYIKKYADKQRLFNLLFLVYIKYVFIIVIVKISSEFHNS